MTITAALVLYAVLWWLTFLVVLPLRLETQGERGEIVPGTHASSPENPAIGPKAKIATLVAAGLWVVIAGIILSGWIEVRDFDWFGVMDESTFSSVD